MQPLVTSIEMKEIDERASEVYGTRTHDLMENAGKGLAKVIQKHYPHARRIAIFCGKGNNGGDGLVAARYLSGKANVVVFLLCNKREIEGEAKANLDKFKGKLFELATEEDFKKTISGAAKADLIVDAIFGTGLRSDLSTSFREIVEGINSLNKTIVSADIPSGINANTGQIMGSAIKAEMTITFGIPKVGLYLFPGSDYAGKIEVVDIGFPEAFGSDDRISTGIIEKDDVRPIFPDRDRDTYKTTFGHLLVVAGSKGKTGAAAMTAVSALRIGAGVVTLAVPKNLQPIFEMKLTEVMTESLPEAEKWHLGLDALDVIMQLANNKQAMALGPGIAPTDTAIKVMSGIIEDLFQPLVIDAGGLDAIASDINILKMSKGIRVITPHPGEMARLIGTSVKEVQSDRVGITRRFAEENNVHVVLKGANTIVASPDGKVFINTTGNPGMATAGSGDVLTGMIGGLMAQGVKAEKATIAAVYLHGLSGDMVRDEKGEYGIIATDIMEKIPYAIKEIKC